MNNALDTQGSRPPGRELKHGAYGSVATGLRPAATLPKQRGCCEYPRRTEHPGGAGVLSSLHNLKVVGSSPGGALVILDVPSV